jgi:cytoskeletal protein CcmA (bactofilin family)
MLTCTAALAGLAAPAWAIDARSGDAVVVSGETINDDLYLSGSSVRVDGFVNGNVFAAGQSVTIEGTVTGSVVAAGQNVLVTGHVGGTVIAAGQTVNSAASIGRDLVAAGSQVTVAEEGSVANDLAMAGAQTLVAAPVGRNVWASGSGVSLDAAVGGDVNAQAEQLSLGRGAVVEGDMSYTSDKGVALAPGASVKGTTTHKFPEKREGTERRSGGLLGAFAARALAWIRGLIGLAIFGLLVVLPFQDSMRRASTTLGTKPLPSIGLGLAFLFIAPVVALMVFVFGLFSGGSWIGLFGLALYAMAIAVGYEVGALWVGTFVLGRLLSKPDVHPGWGVLAGVLVISILAIVPFLGGLITFVATLFGLGALVLTVAARWAPPAVAAEAGPPPAPGTGPPPAPEAAPPPASV